MVRSVLAAFTVTVTVILATVSTSPAETTIAYNGNDYWLNGINVPWNHFGADVGGGSYNPSWFETFFADCEANGINCARLWIHCAGWATPVFDGGGYVTGLNATFLSDLADILAKANDHHVMLMPCLLM